MNYRSHENASHVQNVEDEQRYEIGKPEVREQPESSREQDK